MACDLARARGWADARSLHQGGLVNSVRKIAVPEAILLEQDGSLPMSARKWRGMRGWPRPWSVCRLGSTRLHGCAATTNDRTAGGIRTASPATRYPRGAQLLALPDAGDATTVARPCGARRASKDPSANALPQPEANSRPKRSQPCGRSLMVPWSDQRGSERSAACGKSPRRWPAARARSAESGRRVRGYASRIGESSRADKPPLQFKPSL